MFIFYICREKNNKAIKEPIKKLINRNKGNGPENFLRYKSTSIISGFSIDKVIDRANNINIIKKIRTLNIIIFILCY